MKLRIVTLALAGALLMVVGCSESHDTMPDAAIVFDAELPPPDAGPPPSSVGEPCRGDMDCTGGADTCVDELPGGYCSTFCGGGMECPTGSSCIEVGMGTQLCLADCDPAAGGDQCRAGYGCADIGVCIPGCEDDADCDGGTMCDPSGGFSGEGQCFDPDAALGAACSESGECPSGGFCLPERFGFPGGYCGAFGCDADANTGCPDGGECFPSRGGGICLAGCATDADCPREGYDCQDSVQFPGRLTCQASFDPDNLGQICSAGRGDCTGGACFSESDTGFPDSYCVQVGCDPEATDPGCGGDGVCVLAADGMTGLCLDGCAADSDCRAGYDCRPSDSSDPTSATACMPGCDDASVCGNDGFECNPGTGLCTEPFPEARRGEPCASGEDCPGGRCLAEDDEGWPSGTCSFPGCRLSGTGPEASCPSGGVCVDDKAGDPALGVCVDGCTVTTDCRPGYACVPSDETDPTSALACQPACTDGDCGPGRTCSAATGLCE